MQCCQVVDPLGQSWLGGWGVLSPKGHRQDVQGHRLEARPACVHQGCSVLGPHVSKWQVS